MIADAPRLRRTVASLLHFRRHPKAAHPKVGDDVIDLHCHVLPGIDDGPETIEGSLSLAARASESEPSIVSGPSSMPGSTWQCRSITSSPTLGCAAFGCLLKWRREATVLRSLGASAIIPVERPLAAAAVGAQHRADGVLDAAQHERVAGDAEAQYQPEGQKPVPCN